MLPLPTYHHWRKKCSQVRTQRLVATHQRGSENIARAQALALAQIDRELAAYERSYGQDAFVRSRTLYLLMERDKTGFCMNWQVGSGLEVLGGKEGVIMATNIVSGAQSIYDARWQHKRLWWVDLADSMLLQQLAVSPGQRVFDQELPRYGDPAPSIVWPAGLM